MYFAVAVCLCIKQGLNRLAEPGHTLGPGAVIVRHSLTFFSEYLNGKIMKSLRSIFVSCLLAGLTLAASAQAPPVRVAQLIATDGTLVAGDVSFSHFRQLPSNIIFTQSTPLDGVGNIAASAAVNADASVSLVFTAIDPATGASSPITAAYQQSIAYDVTVTNPALLLGTVNQDFGSTTTYGFNFLQYREPAPYMEPLVSGSANAVTTDATLIYDFMLGVNPVQIGTNAPGTPQISRFGVLYPRSCATIYQGVVLGQFGGPNGCASALPGGNRANLSLRSFFGAVTDRHNFVIGSLFPFVLDSVAVKFTLVPAGSAVTSVPVALSGIDISQPGLVTLSLAHTVDADGFSHPGFAPAGGVPVTLTTSAASALPLPPTVTIAQGASTLYLPVADANIDVPTRVVAMASYNGATVQQTATLNPAVPLSLSFAGNTLVGGLNLPRSIRLTPILSRANFSPAVITLASSNPAYAPVPASVTIPALVGQALIVVPLNEVPGNATVSFSATFNGATQNLTFALPGRVDFVGIGKAELAVKNGSLKVDATSSAPNAVLTLYNDATGAFIGTMTNTGLITYGAKYSYQGSVSSVKTLRLKSKFNGTTTFAVAQK